MFFGLLFAVYQRNDIPPVIDTPAQIETFKNYDELNTMIDTLNNRAAQAKKILEASNLDGPQMGGGDNEAHTNSQITGVIDADTIDNVNVMNESNGFLTIITTKLDKMDKPIASTLYVLDKDLNVIEKTEDFAAGKSVQAALFTDNKAYVSLFHNENPMLSVIDFSNEKTPSVESSVELGGVMHSLVPVNDNQLLGIGNMVEPAGEGGSSEYGFKLVLLDVSSENAKITDSFETDAYNLTTWYETNIDLFVDSENHAYATAVAFMDEQGYWNGDGLLKFRINNNHFEINEDTDEFYNEYVEGCYSAGNIEIGNYIYSFSVNNSDEQYGFIISAHKYK